jgi:hypothetical protein
MWNINDVWAWHGIYAIMRMTIYGSILLAQSCRGGRKCGTWNPPKHKGHSKGKIKAFSGKLVKAVEIILAFFTYRPVLKKSKLILIMCIVYCNMYGSKYLKNESEYSTGIGGKSFHMWIRMCRRRTTRTIRAEHDTTRNYYIYKLRRIWSTWILVLITSVFVLYSSFRYTVSPPNLEPSEIE